MKYHPRVMGFSLIELLIVMAIMGILSVTTVIVLDSRQKHAVGLQADTLRHHLAHTQLLAISQQQRLKLTVDNAGGRYQVDSCSSSSCTSTVPVVDPATGQAFTIWLADGMTMAPINGSVIFDSLGRPQITQSMLFTLSVPGRSVGVRVFPVTGYATLEY